MFITKLSLSAFSYNILKLIDTELDLLEAVENKEDMPLYSRKLYKRNFIKIIELLTLLKLESNLRSYLPQDYNHNTYFHNVVYRIFNLYKNIDFINISAPQEIFNTLSQLREVIINHISRYNGSIRFTSESELQIFDPFTENQFESINLYNRVLHGYILPKFNNIKCNGLFINALNEQQNNINIKNKLTSNIETYGVTANPKFATIPFIENYEYGFMKNVQTDKDFNFVFYRYFLAYASYPFIITEQHSSAKNDSIIDQNIYNKIHSIFGSETHRIIDNFNILDITKCINVLKEGGLFISILPSCEILKLRKNFYENLKNISLIKVKHKEIYIVLGVKKSKNEKQNNELSEIENLVEQTKYFIIENYIKNTDNSIDNNTLNYVKINNFSPIKKFETGFISINKLNKLKNKFSFLEPFARYTAQINETVNNPLLPFAKEQLGTVLAAGAFSGKIYDEKTKKYHLIKTTLRHSCVKREERDGQFIRTMGNVPTILTRTEDKLHELDI